MIRCSSLFSSHRLQRCRRTLCVQSCGANNLPGSALPSEPTWSLEDLLAVNESDEALGMLDEAKIKQLEGMAQVSLDGGEYGDCADSKARRKALASDLSRAILFTRAVTRAAADLGCDSSGEDHSVSAALNAFDDPALGFAPTSAKLREDFAAVSPGGDRGQNVLGQARKRVGQFFVVPKT